MASFISVHDLPDGARALLLDCHLSYDACNVKQGLIYMKSSGTFLGMVADVLDFRKNIGSQLIQKGFLISLRSNPYSNFRFPLIITGVQTETSESIMEALMPLMTSISEYINSFAGKIHFAVCDGAPAHYQVSIIFFYVKRERKKERPVTCKYFMHVFI